MLAEIVKLLLNIRCLRAAFLKLEFKSLVVNLHLSLNALLGHSLELVSNCLIFELLDLVFLGLEILSKLLLFLITVVLWVALSDRDLNFKFKNVFRDKLIPCNWFYIEREKVGLLAQLFLARCLRPSVFVSFVMEGFLFVGLVLFLRDIKEDLVHRFSMSFD